MNVIKNNVLYGLVLIGGESSRMGQDKGMLRLYDKPQFAHCFELLDNFCSKTFLSLRKDQPLKEGMKAYPGITDMDRFSVMGPLGGILSAMHKHPHADWLILAVDLPFVDRPTLKRLVDHHRSENVATAYKSTYDSLPEPLCAIYSARSGPMMEDFVQKGGRCPRKFLINAGAELLDQLNDHSLDNINTPQELEQAKARMKEEKVK